MHPVGCVLRTQTPSLPSVVPATMSGPVSPREQAQLPMATWTQPGQEESKTPALQ